MAAIALAHSHTDVSLHIPYQRHEPYYDIYRGSSLLSLLRGDVAFQESERRVGVFSRWHREGLIKHGDLPSRLLLTLWQAASTQKGINAFRGQGCGKASQRDTE